MAKLIRKADPTTGQVQSHDASYWARAQAHANAKKAVTRAVNPLSGQTVAHSKGAWDKITRQYVKKYGPLDITAPMGPYDVASSINAATRQKFDPQYKTLADQTSASNQQDRNLADWYGQYRAQLNDAASKSAAANQQAQAFTANMANSSSALDAQQRGVIAQQNQASAAQRGAQVDPNQALVGQQADQSRRQNLTQQGALNAQQGANTQTYFGGRQATTSGQELAGHQAEAKNRQNISKAVQALQGSEGDYRTTLRQQIQASERQNQLARATFGLNESKAAADAAAKQAAAAGTAAGRAETGRHNRATEGSTTAAQRAAAAKDAYQRAHGLGPYKPAGSGRGGSGGLTPSQQRKATQQQKDATNFLGSYRVPLPNGTARGLNYTYDFTGAGYQNTVDAVRRNAHVPYSVARAAVDAFMKRTWPGRFGGKVKPQPLNRPQGSRPG